VLLGPDGRELWRTPWRSNVLADALRNILAALVMGDPQGDPITWWALGRGVAAWDVNGPPDDAARRTRTTLYQEAARQAVSAGQMAFIGGAFTNRLEIVSTFTTADVPAGLLREFGLVAGGTAALDSGLLINHRAHPAIDLQPGLTLQRTLRLTF
jgi:hypothetical protein